MFAQPVTFVVLVLLILLLVGGVMLIRGALNRGASAVCPRCQRANPSDAQFCGHCGSSMS